MSVTRRKGPSPKVQVASGPLIFEHGVSRSPGPISKNELKLHLDCLGEQIPKDAPHDFIEDELELLAAYMGIRILSWDFSSGMRQGINLQITFDWC